MVHNCVLNLLTNTAVLCEVPYMSKRAWEYIAHCRPYPELVSVEDAESLAVNAAADVVESVLLLPVVDLLVDVTQNVVDQIQRLAQQPTLRHVRL